MKKVLAIIYIFSCTNLFATEEIIKILKLKNVFTINEFIKIADLTNKDYKVLPYLTLKRSFVSRDKVPNDEIDKWLNKNAGWEQIVFYDDLSDDEIKNSSSEAIKFIKAKKFFEQGEYRKSIQEIRSMDKNGRIYHRSLYLLGLLFIYNNQFEAATDAFKGCIRNFEKSLDSKETIIKETAQFIIDKCQIAISRVNFKNKSFDEAIENYKKIPIQSYEWPESLLELAWAFYIKKDYPRSYARNLTLENKSFSKFMFAENRLLGVLNLKQNCYLKQALDLVTKSVDEFNEALKELSSYDELDESNNWKLLEKDKVQTPFVALRKKIIKQIEYDLKRLEREPETIVKSTFEQELLKLKNKISKEMNAFVKKHLKRKYLSMSRNVEDLIAVKLSIINEIKLEENNTKKQKSKKKEKNNKVKWKFSNEYWPDELEDISVSLESRCS